MRTVEINALLISIKHPYDNVNFGPQAKRNGFVWYFRDQRYLEIMKIVNNKWDIH